MVPVTVIVTVLVTLAVSIFFVVGFIRFSNVFVTTGGTSMG